tara:strand:+ start:524 stop:1015 length:492 start_codon:yes stop_codon:yes gene_type:complete
MNYLKISLGIFVALAASRFIPHPPNFTSLLALSFYVPVIFGIRFIPAILICFAITDYFIGFHSTTFFTWGSIVFIGLLSRYFNKNILVRVSGALAGCCIFFIITNFGVWSLGSYGYSIEGFLLCYTLAIPFFTYSLISTFIFSGIIETISRLNIIKSLNLKNI